MVRRQLPYSRFSSVIAYPLSCTFEFKIQNDGVKDVGEFNVEFMFDDKVEGIRKFKELRRGYGQEVTFTLKNIDDGEHKISFKINLDKEQITPYNEGKEIYSLRRGES